MHGNVLSSIIDNYQDREAAFVHQQKNGSRRYGMFSDTYPHIQECCSTIKKNEILPFARTWMELEDIMVSEINQRKTNTEFYHLYLESKK